ncbi:MAG: branched chain amino acid aminotransferase, partial [Natronospirillum sp.]
GTAAEVLPIRQLDGRVIGEGRRGPVTTELQTLYFDAVKGKLPGHAEWLAPIAD